MDDLIAISTLNDFIFCPYSIYLHNVYMDMDKDAYHATPQTRGRNAHAAVDNKTATTNNNIIESLPVISNELGVYGNLLRMIVLLYLTLIQIKLRNMAMLSTVTKI